MPCQRRNRKSRASKWNKIHCSILLHALLPKNARETCEGRSGLVGPESHGRGRLSEINILVLFYFLMNYARHTLYISSVYKAVKGLAYSTACLPPRWLWQCIGLYRKKSERYDSSIRTLVTRGVWHFESSYNFKRFILYFII